MHLRVLATFLILNLGLPAAAWAHALLLSSDPPSGATVTQTELDLSLRFNSRIDAGRSRLTVKTADGRTAQLQAKGGNDPTMLTGHAGQLKPGKAVLHWEVLSVDGHISRGDVPFTVALP